MSCRPWRFRPLLSFALVAQTPPKPVEQDSSAKELEAGALFRTGKTYKVTVLPTGHLRAVLLDWTGTRPIAKAKVEAKGPKGKKEKTYTLETDAAGLLSQPDVLLGEYTLKVADKHWTRVPAVLTPDEVHSQAVYGVGGPGELDEDPDPGPKPEPEDEHFFKCSNIEGPHFEFDRSFVRPSVSGSLKPIADALQGDTKRQAFLFGHTDKVGTEEYNKGLSERRARAVYALLVHDKDEWEALYNQESWGIRAVQLMLQHLGHEPGSLGSNDEKTKSAVKKFQAQNGLEQDGIAGPNTRAALFARYFEKVHTPAFGPERFADWKFMGCSEFNPLVDTEKPEEQNRRVVAFVFTPKEKPQGLPCKLGSLAPCKQSKKPEGTKGRVASFTCGVFDDISSRCGCEKPLPPTDVPFELQIAVPEEEAALVVLDGTTEKNRILASVAKDLGSGLRGFDLQHLEHAKTYRLELRGADEAILSAWRLVPGEYHRAAEKGDVDGLGRAFGPLPVL